VIDGGTAERYGVVNRALPDADLDGFVAKLAGEIAGLDRQVLGDAKALIDRATLPAEVDLVTASNAFFESAARRAA
jgi:enoyl-CoA hydratase/carnithine racemase